MAPTLELIVYVSLLATNFGFTSAQSVLQNNLTIIQGVPCGRLSELIKEEVTSWPKECDNFCVRTASCESFVWSREHSTCKLYPHQLVDDCYVRADHDFWFQKNFLLWRRNFTLGSFVALTKGNDYGMKEDVLPLVPVINYVADLKTWEGARGYCRNLDGYQLYSPRNLAELESLVSHTGATGVSFWVGYRWFQTGGGVSGFVSVETDSYMILSSNPMWVDSATLTAGPYDSSHCAYYDHVNGGLNVKECSNTLGSICIPIFHSDVCESANSVPLQTELLNSEYFFSLEDCSLKHAQDVPSSRISTVERVFHRIGDQVVLEQASNSNPSGDYSTAVIFRLTTACFSFSPGERPTEHSCEGSELANTLNVCQATMFASHKLVSFSDAEHYCALNSALLPTVAEAESNFQLIKAMSCDWTLIRVSDAADQVVRVDTSGSDLETVLISNDDGSLQYDFFDTVLCKW